MIYLRSGCKINLFLKIGAKWANGLHAISSLFLPLQEPEDTICIERRNSGTLEFSASREELNAGDNLVLRACRAYAKETAFAPGLKITLLKKVPLGAGLGGGSANAATMLLWLNSISPAPLSSQKLSSLAGSLGSDVPFFLYKAPALVEGTGNVVRPVLLLEKPFAIVFVWPEIGISTPWAFESLDRLRESSGAEKNLTKSKAQTTNFSFAVTGNMSEIYRLRLENDLEKPVIAAWPQLAELKNKFYGLGAAYAGMSGSGSTMFGIFANILLAREAWARLSAEYAHVYIARYPFTGV